MSDIVARIRNLCTHDDGPEQAERLADEAADEIERLRKAVRQAHALIDNDLVIPWIIANELDDVLGINQQLKQER